MQTNWDDLRLVLAVARGRGLTAAAQSLGGNQSTVFRRLNAVEGAVGARLFERAQGVYLATPAGDAVLRAAERMEGEALAVEREIAGGDARLRGAVRVTCSETLAFRILTPHLARLRA